MKTLFTFLFIAIIGITCKAQGTFETIASGNWNNAATWTLTAGTDANGIPDADDDVVIMTGHTAVLNVEQSYAKTLVISNGATLNGNNKRLGMKGNFTNNGNVTGNTYLYMQATNAILFSTTTYTAPGQIYIQLRCTLAAGTVINKTHGISIQNNNVGVVNYASVTLRNSGGNNGTIACNKTTNFWKNEAGSSLSIQANPTNLIPAKFTCSVTANSVTYSGTSPNIVNTSYYNLNLTGSGVKNLTTNLRILNDLSVSSGTLSSNTSNNIRVGRNLTCNGYINLSSTDTLTFNGSAPQTVSGTATQSLTNVVIDNSNGTGSGNGVTFNTNTYVTYDLFMRQGNCNGNGRLLLKSDASQTARLAAITNTAGVSFSGNTIVQKFFPEYVAQYYDMATPVSNTTVNDWDDEIYISGIGVYDGIVGPAGVDGASPSASDPSGFAYTMNTYDEPSNSFVQITEADGSNMPLVPGVGYNLLFADNGGLTLFFEKIVDTRGTPTFGDVALTGLTYSAGAGEGWHLVGNPYASHIDYALTTKVRMTSNIYYTDNGLYSLWPNGSIIPPYQGFYVETTNSPLAHSLTFTEACKVVNYTTEFYRSKPNYDIQLMVSSPIVEYQATNTIHFDEQASVNYDEQFDASYRKYPHPISPAIYMLDKTINKSMIKNVINSKEEEVAIPLGIFTPKSGTYYIDLSVLNSDAYTEIWIENTKTGVKYNNVASLIGEELGTNMDFVLKMSKKNKVKSSTLTSLSSDLLVFVSENTLNLKSTSSNRTLPEVSIYDMTGKLMLKQNNVLVNNENITKIDISGFSTGVYIVNTIGENGAILNKKIVK